ncbi:MAG: C13 family peptidase [Gallionella sp.]
MKKFILISVALHLSIASCVAEEIRIPSYSAAGRIAQGYGEAALPDGGLYKGQFANGQLNGTGVLTWQNGNKYEGEFKAGLFHGHGVVTAPNGDVYRGEFYEGYESGAGVMTFANGDRYEGDFKQGMFDGKGIFIDASGGSYKGDFLLGEFTGMGSSTTVDGDKFEGHFLNWRLSGTGICTLKSGDRYEGQFADGIPSGQMKVKYQGGNRYEGGMAGWEYHGQGVLTSSDGEDSFSGRFEQGTATGIMTVIKKDAGEEYHGELERWLYHGKGKLAKSDGTKYEGDFKYGMYNGKGVLITPDSRKYVGEFEYDNFNGNGTLEFRSASGKRKKLTGKWRSGKYTGDDAAAYVQDGLANINVEKVMYAQTDKVADALKKLAPQVSEQADLYFVGFGAYGEEDVFMNEVRNASSLMNKLYNVGNHSISLINNPKAVEDVPLATVTNLERVLHGIAKQMDVNEDILFLYVSSHGSKDHDISVSLDGVSLQKLTPKRFKEIVDESGIKWKVLLISACYSGGLIAPLKDEHTLIMTASQADKTSFGCGAEAKLTYFGQAYFEQSLNPQVSFIDAFAHARELISVREKKEKRESSDPQIFSTPQIEKKLASWHRSNQLKSASPR